MCFHGKQGHHLPGEAGQQPAEVKVVAGGPWDAEGEGESLEGMDSQKGCHEGRR